MESDRFDSDTIGALFSRQLLCSAPGLLDIYFWNMIAPTAYIPFLERWFWSPYFG